MSAYLLRDAAPLSAQEWAKIDDMVVTVLTKNLVGRRLLTMVGPLGWGIQQAPVHGFEQTDGAAVMQEKGAYLPLEEVSAEFVLRARQIAMAAATPFGLDLGAVAIAAAAVARQEDQQVLGGLLNASGATTMPLGDWDVMGGPFRAVAEARASMLAKGFDGPYALVVGPTLYARLASIMGHGRREIEAVEKLVKEGIFQSTLLPEGKALLISPQPWNMDLVVGQDAVTAYVGNQGLDHRFRIFETLVLRIKQAGSICVLE